MAPSKLKAGFVVWPNLLTTLIMSIMASYLTGAWELSITHAAAIVNLYSGVVGIMPVGMICIVYMTGYMGSYWMILLSRFAFTAGLVLLAMSTPPVLAGATGTCSAYKAECIGQVQKVLFYTSLPLIAVGVSAYLGSALTFIDELLPQTNPEQLPPPESEQLPPPPEPENEWFFGVISMIFFPGAALLAIGYINPWSIKFGIGAICTVVSTIIFLCGLCSFPRGRGAGQKPISLTKMFRKQDAKSILRLMPTCMTCILTGIVVSIGKTYFIEQATDMNPHVGRLLVPTIVLPICFQGFLKAYLANQIKWCAADPRFGIAMSKIIATLCCITAAKVETRRLGVVRREGLIDDNTKTIPMTMFWLVPQFLLLGLAEELSEKSIVCFFTDRLEIKTPEEDKATKESKNMYMKIFAQAVSGVGILCGVLSVYAVGEVSARVGGSSWFQFTLNRSRLDNYYWTLAALTAINLVLDLLVRCVVFRD
ncbi:protein NRT1/ PTR FAMILY 5.5-like [Prunus yedoensis var. nudiflora]|uniref:Protein NRT1/ PTR FAMILY 5.5-like n=1 Tax=Prunus yedoensis var. nudiflora TaxID=2094558 RepID=A0A314XPG4_PRUYE|nr:protein NRT1/ PTR FAMILY 5.5-like [Prunus yedoensis var. nudiflora]